MKQCVAMEVAMNSRIDEKKNSAEGAPRAGGGGKVRARTLIAFAATSEGCGGKCSAAKEVAFTRGGGRGKPHSSCVGVGCTCTQALIAIAPTRRCRQVDDNKKTLNVNTTLIAKFGTLITLIRR